MRLEKAHTYTLIPHTHTLTYHRHTSPTYAPAAAFPPCSADAVPTHVVVGGVCVYMCVCVCVCVCVYAYMCGYKMLCAVV
jgi:hypothetical protein